MIMDRFINQQAVFDTVCRLCGKRGTCNPDICGYIEAFRDIPVIDAKPIVRCKDCKHWMPYDWMFSEVWQSNSIMDYDDHDIGCEYCDMNMGANDYCSRWEKVQ